MHVSFDDWTRGRALCSLGTNAGAAELPFQRWRNFKEAFAPELVARAVAESAVPIQRCLDPFGGSGTTALACQFLGVHSVTIEVNPFLADLIEAKLVSYDSDALARDFARVVHAASIMADSDKNVFRDLPPTFIEPGVNGRWIFDEEIAARIAIYISAIRSIVDLNHRRLFLILLGGILVAVSNIIVNGKGRRYRRGWAERKQSPGLVDQHFNAAVQRAITEIHRYAHRKCETYEIRRGDCRRELEDIQECDIAVFSPPYPNSFDYTDVYNIELWILGYLRDSKENRILRTATLSSHVQVSRPFSQHQLGSRLLDQSIDALTSKRSRLWDPRLPEMISGYFADMLLVLKKLYCCTAKHGRIWMIVGDSCYAEVVIKTATILIELSSDLGWHLVTHEPCRSMRTSAQHGGEFELSETLLVLSKG